MQQVLVSEQRPDAGGLSSFHGSGTLSFSTVKSLINSARPPCARQGWSGGGGHFMAIVCYFQGLLGLIAGAGSTAKRLRISDPGTATACLTTTCSCPATRAAEPGRIPIELSLERRKLCPC